MYPLYFATSKAAMVAALKKGLKHLRALPPILEDKAALKSMMRVVMFNRLDPKFEIRAVEDLLATIQAARFPMAAMRDYVESRRVYNETRRWIRPQREFDQAAIEHIVRQHKKAIAKAEGALRQLAAPADAPLAAGVRAWLEFLESELAATVPPTAVCGREPGEFHRFRHDHCLRSGEYFTDDFLGFFRPLDYLRLTDQGFQVWHTDEELVLHFREAGVDMAQRKARWAEYRGTSSDSFVTRVFVDSEGKGLAAETFIAWPMGEGVSVGRRPFCEARTRFTSDETSWQLELRLAYSLFGRTPKKGDAWGLNVTFNPAVASVAAHTWAATYDSNVPRLYGKVKFA
jgi:hypothetical protein